MSDTPNQNVFFRGDDMGIGNFPIKGGKMSNQPINTEGPAFPVNPHPNIHGGSDGMTIRQYAAIKLRVPDSGTDWLDEMIRKSNRDYFAAAALSSRGMYGANIRENAVAKECYIIADAMLKAREGK